MKRSLARGLAAACAAVSVFALQAPATATAVQLKGQVGIQMQAQEKSNWCWDASGNTIAAYFGHTLSQTKFCQVAHNESGTTCANNQGYLSDQQRVFRWLGFSNAGTYNSNGQTLSFASIKSQIDAGRPIGTRIGWSNGGGHMHVLYGYDNSTSTSKVDFGDPWGSNPRYNHMNYTSYLRNSQFTWTHTVYGIED
ncbi:Papain-like cysteine protease AvrRpt2 [Amycolatopsis xylanica]|uniref:Papain-like cysteine protease AvrRpt2 n=1 Tax=Amycolatopsis xylanica TaxID=589385 RepID=A0A1H3D2X7_9PSEU|nr:papain-like cysteine protease family protein [Amycolatopsis xylanica]SDX60725.1 Papain-like cysteine protease AvrRpt2 [Amycolatopsis xylanica]